MCCACTERHNASERGRKESKNNRLDETWEGVFGKAADGIKREEDEAREGI